MDIQMHKMVFYKKMLPLKAISILCICCITAMLYAQPLSSDAIIEKALSQHPTMRIAQLEIDKAQSLQRTAFNPEQPTFEVEFPSDIELGFEIEQSIEFPLVYTRRSAWLKSKTSLAEVAAGITRLEIIRTVRLEYLQAQLLQEQQQYFKQQDSLWNSIALNSSRLFDAGQITRGSS
jgi:cobalt-zinc-cadmium resistance protein CzcA